MNNKSKSTTARLTYSPLTTEELTKRRSTVEFPIFTVQWLSLSTGVDDNTSELILFGGGGGTAGRNVDSGVIVAEIDTNESITPIGYLNSSDQLIPNIAVNPSNPNELILTVGRNAIMTNIQTNLLSIHKSIQTDFPAIELIKLPTDCNNYIEIQSTIEYNSNEFIAAIHSFNSTGEYFASAGSDGCVRIWNTSTLKLLGIGNSNNQSITIVKSIAESILNQTKSTVEKRQEELIKLNSLLSQTRQNNAVFRPPTLSKLQCYSPNSLAFNSNSTKLLCADGEGAVRIYDLTKIINTQSNTNNDTKSIDSNIITGYSAYQVPILNIRHSLSITTNKFIKPVFHRAAYYTDPVDSKEYVIATVNYLSTVGRKPQSTASYLFRFDSINYKILQQVRVKNNSTAAGSALTILEINAQSNLIAVINNQSQLFIYTANTFKLLNYYQLQRWTATAAAFAPNQHKLIVVSADNDSAEPYELFNLNKEYLKANSKSTTSSSSLITVIIQLILFTIITLFLWNCRNIYSQ